MLLMVKRFEPVEFTCNVACMQAHDAHPKRLYQTNSPAIV